MPNWCQNVIYVNHQDFKLMESTLEAIKQGRLCDHIIPYPDVFKDIHSGYCTINGEDHEVWRVDAPRDADYITKMDADNIPIPEKEQKEIIRKYGCIKPIDWTSENWGMKWDISEVEYHGFGELDLHRSFGLHCFKFDTPWCSPIPVFEKMHQLGYVLFAEYVEYGMGFCGQFMDGKEYYNNSIPDDWNVHKYLEQVYS
tara:strand:- start:900 stop:1496 length:597 start_codon:yes stop_codon:yes gene_type:complete